MKPMSTWGSAEHFPAASGRSRSVAAHVCSSCFAQSFIPTENFIHFFSFNDARSRPNHATCNAFCISTVFVIWLTHLKESKFLLTPLLTCDMHIYENLTSFSVKETGNKQSSSPSHSRRDALCEDLGRGYSRCFQQVQGWGFKGQQVEQPPTFDWFQGHVTPESSKTDPGPASQHCTSASMQLCKVTIPWGGGIASSTEHAQCIMGVLSVNLATYLFSLLEHTTIRTQGDVQNMMYFWGFIPEGGFKIGTDSREGWRRRRRSWESNAWTSADCEINH